jgi:protein-L-isoaspartate(D-aspartate) O-methyltransferase
MKDNLSLLKSRKIMIDNHLLARGIKDKRILSAFSVIPREEFIPAEYKDSAYEDYPIGIGCGQTISQPYIAALMTELLFLQGNERVLEIGTGCGYQSAILSVLCEEVFTIERIPELAESARKIFDKLGFNNISVIIKDGSLGLKEFAPYQGIIVTCAAPDVPKALKQQLADNGRLVAPVGSRHSQELVLIEKSSGHFKEKSFGLCAFVPLIGKYGWDNI